jgi:nucleoside-diphosphate-sugar epimerase
MPLARIITPVAADASAVADRLRAHGYRVEVVGPEQIHISPADLEVNLQKCSVREALAQAVEAAGRSGSAEVFVHPDAVTAEALAAAETGA